MKFKDLQSHKAYADKLSIELGKNPQRARNAVSEHGLHQAVYNFVMDPEPSEGLLWAIENGIPEHSMEQMAIDHIQEFPATQRKPLLAMAKFKLEKYGKKRIA